MADCRSFISVRLPRLARLGPHEVVVWKEQSRNRRRTTYVALQNVPHAVWDAALR